MEIRSIGVVGAGKMGSGIALSGAMSGYKAVVQERSQTELERARTNIGSQLQRLVDKHTLSAEQGAAVRGRIEMTCEFQDFEELDFVIEAVPESMELKTTVLAQLDVLCKKDAILASNTSTLSITTLASATKRPEQVVGMHFFIPPTKLVEIIRGYYTSDETVKQAKLVASRMGRIFVEVKKDSPGFIANRIYTPLFLEAFKAYEEGLASKEDIDLAMKNSYLPIGPFELADIIGLDVLDAGFDYYQKELGPTWNPPQSFKRLVRAGRLGKKTGRGWYEY